MQYNHNRFGIGYIDKSTSEYYRPMPTLAISKSLNNDNKYSLSYQHYDLLANEHYY